MPYELPTDPRTERRARLTGRLSFVFAALLVVLVTYLGYVGFEGSRQLTDAPHRSADCRTPATLGWDYEAINYDIATDAELADEPDPRTCSRLGAPAGDEVTTPDGMQIAGWWIPAERSIGPSGPTVVLVHGWGSNKSGMLAIAEVLHAEYNLVLPDLRNHGQSSSGTTTQGVLEQQDLRAIVDWLVEAKGPEQIALLGSSMGGATSAALARTDRRIDALILDSTHATLANAAAARLAVSGYPLSVPGSWAILLGALFRTGQDVSLADPISSVARLGDRPLLILGGGLDDTIGPTDSAEMLAAAIDAGVRAELVVCDEAGHGAVIATCPDAYPGWVLGFLERAFTGD